MQMMPSNDDIDLPQNLLRNALVQRYPLHCNSRKLASVWIGEALETERLCSFKCEGSKLTKVCLPTNFAMDNGNIQPTIWTPRVKLLMALLSLELTGVIPRTEAIASLAETFATMQTRFNRMKAVF